MRGDNGWEYTWSRRIPVCVRLGWEFVWRAKRDRQAEASRVCDDNIRLNTYSYDHVWPVEASCNMQGLLSKDISSHHHFGFLSCIVHLPLAENECMQSAMGFLPYFPHLSVSYVCHQWTLNHHHHHHHHSNSLCSKITFSLGFGIFFSILFFVHKFTSTKKKKKLGQILEIINAT